MTRQEVVRFVTTSLKSQFRREGVTPLPFIVGRYGVGKSSLADAIARSLSKKSVFIVVSGLDPSLSHFPVLTDGEVSYKVWRGWMDDGIVVVLDEFDKASPHSVNFLLPILSVRKIQDSPIRCGIVLLGNSTEILHRVPALRTRLQVVTLDDPTVSEVFGYLQQKYGDTIQNPNFLHFFTLVHEFVERKGFTETLAPRVVDALLAYIEASEGVVTLDELKPFLSELYPEFVTFVNEVRNYPNPHTTNTSEIVNFVKLTPTIAHYYFTRMYVSHLFTCHENHPLDFRQFLHTLRKHNPTLLDTAISSVIIFQNSPNYFNVVSQIADDPELSNIVTKVVRGQL